jgi:hypothetical protein
MLYNLFGEAINDHGVMNPGNHITVIGCSKWDGAENYELFILVDFRKNKIIED